MKKRVLVAMSGGVDSTVSAALLQQEGYDVVGITMDTGYGTAPSDAALMAKHLGIDHHIIDVKQAFHDSVIKDFVYSYLHGQTPNPCVVCNEKVKFCVCMSVMHELDAVYFATGHYVKRLEKNGRFLLACAEYRPKDQSYYLYRLTQNILAKCLFPLGSYSKVQIRQMALAWSLPAADKADSQDICFIPSGDYREFLKEHLDESYFLPGEITDCSGKLIGEHRGLAFYTVGQRKGLGVALGYPAYVVALDTVHNRLVLGVDQDLLASDAISINHTFLPFDRLDAPMRADVKIRYKSPAVAAMIYPMDDDKIRIVFDNPQKSVTPGQAAVFYDGDIVVGGGTIIS